MNSYSNYIAGADVPAADGRTFTAFNPTTGDVWGTFALAGPAVTLIDAGPMVAMIERLIGLGNLAV